MVQPMDYTLSVASPFARAVEGMDAGLRVQQGARQEQLAQSALRTEEQMMGLRAAQEDRAQAAFGMDQQVFAQQQAALQAQQERAQAAQQALVQLAETPNAGSREYADLILRFPEFAEETQKAFQLMDSDQRQRTLTDALQVYTALSGGNTGAAQSLLERRLEAAEASEDEEAAQAARASLEVLDMDPDALRTSLGLQIAVVGDGKYNDLLDKPADPTAAMKEYQAAVDQGYTGTFIEYKERMAQAGRAQTNVNVGPTETAFDEATGKVLAAEAAEVATQGAQAQRSLGLLNTLEDALLNSPSGAGGSLANFAANLGIKSSGSSNIELANAIISQLVPQQRPPGSGVMSDADLELFKQSLPRLINTREGNRKIVDTMRAIAQYDVERGKIARALQTKEITLEEAFQRYAALGNPVAEFVADTSGQSGPEPVAPPATGRAPEVDNFFQNLRPPAGGAVRLENR